MAEKWEKGNLQEPIMSTFNQLVAGSNPAGRTTSFAKKSFLLNPSTHQICVVMAFPARVSETGGNVAPLGQN
jgi:hypothetical protein